MMTLDQCIEYIIPYIKTTGKKSLGGKILLIDNLLISINGEDSQLFTMTLPQPTGQYLALDKTHLLDMYTEGNYIPEYMYYDYRIHYNLLGKYNFYSSLNNPIYVLENISNDEFMSPLFKLKSADGLKLYNLENIILLPFSYSMIPVTKADKVDLRVYTYDNISNIVQYTINKKKLKTVINIYMKLLKG